MAAGQKEKDGLEGGISVVKTWPCYFCCFPEDGWAPACQWKLMNEFLTEFLLYSCDSELVVGWAVRGIQGQPTTVP